GLLLGVCPPVSSAPVRCMDRSWNWSYRTRGSTDTPMGAQPAAGLYQGRVAGTFDAGRAEGSINAKRRRGASPGAFGNADCGSDQRACLRRNVSARPPGSTIFCLPVENGWHCEHTSIGRSSPRVERVSKVFPQLQVTLIIL